MRRALARSSEMASEKPKPDPKPESTPPENVSPFPTPKMEVVIGSAGPPERTPKGRRSSRGR